MTYVVTEACIKCKYTDCVEVCPVDCFYEGENMLVINPSECIDCGVCEPECPAEAILPDTEDGLEKILELNAKYSAEWNSSATDDRAGAKIISKMVLMVPPAKDAMAAMVSALPAIPLRAMG